MTSATNATSAKHCGQQKLIGSSTPYRPKRSRSCRNNPQRFSERRTESGQSEGAPTIGCPYLIENLAPQVGLVQRPHSVKSCAFSNLLKILSRTILRFRTILLLRRSIVRTVVQTGNA